MLGCVLVHGFTGSPYDMGFLGEGLAQAGFPVEIPLLTGHAGGARGIARATVADWRRDVSQPTEYLYRRTGVPPLVIGFSMGGLLALDLALSRAEPLTGVASLSAPLALPMSARFGADVAQRLGPLGRTLAWPKFTGPDIATGERLPGAETMPLCGVAELLKLIEVVRRRLHILTSPLLVLHAAQDHTAPPESATDLVSRAGSSWVRMVTLETGFHVIPRDVCREQVSEELLAFARWLREGGEPAFGAQLLA